MLNLARESRLSEKEFLEKARNFFGPGGYGLAIVDEAPGYIAFEGGGGGVEVITRPEGNKTGVEITSREWDIQAREFIGKIK